MTTLSGMTQKTVSTGSDVGKGTPGSRLKAAWRAAKTSKPLREFVRAVTGEDADAWFDSKRPGGGQAVRKAKKAKSERVKYLAISKKSSGSVTISVPKKTKGKGDGR